MSTQGVYYSSTYVVLLPRLQKNLVDFDDELKIRDIRFYYNITKITIKVQLF